MMMRIKIDMREHELINMCKHYLEIMPTCKGIEMVVESLPIGDIILTYNDVEKIIIERKSLGDLASSIKDGRYEEQSYRLNGIQHHNHNIIYLIEGDINRINTFKSRIDKMTLYSAMVSILCYKGFSLMRSSNMEETAIMICNMAYKIRKSELDGKKLYNNNNSPITLQVVPVVTIENATEIMTTEIVPIENVTIENVTIENVSAIVIVEDKTEEKEYCAVVKRVKKENITKNNIGEIMLCQIPGISSVSALAIMSQFKTFQNLIICLKENKNCLKDIQYTNASGQTRKISKTIVENIVNYLHHE